MPDEHDGQGGGREVQEDRSGIEEGWREGLKGGQTAAARSVINLLLDINLSIIALNLSFSVSFPVGTLLINTSRRLKFKSERLEFRF